MAGEIPFRFNELQGNVGGISSNVLWDGFDDTEENQPVDQFANEVDDHASVIRRVRGLGLFDVVDPRDELPTVEPGSDRR